ncbi:DUF5709 domain-containing protein [Nocardioides sp. C4-1]|uniref:DUF5709 domain-containing protein n=1 Tax=Nocardioides sp. C4-1 TaxID=3151851 RepID=UPI003266A10A
MSQTDDPTTDAESYGDYSVDDEDQPVGGDDLVTGDSDVTDELDRGYSPPEKWSAGQGFGNTPYEEAVGETLEQRLAQEEPDVDPAQPDEQPDEQYDATIDDEVGDLRAGRLVASDEGVRDDGESDVLATDVGIDGAAASAEEAAMHVVDDEDPR